MTETQTKVAIVTGSTQGLGEAIARELVAEKMIGGLVICGRNAAGGRRLAGEFTERGCKTEFVSADLSRVEDCRQVIEAAGVRLLFDRNGDAVGIALQDAGNDLFGDVSPR